MNTHQGIESARDNLDKVASFFRDFKDMDFRLIKNDPEGGKLISTPTKLDWVGDGWECDLIFEDFNRTQLMRPFFDSRCEPLTNSNIVSICDLEVIENKIIANHLVKWAWIEGNTCFIEI